MAGNDTMLGTKGKLGKLGTEKKTPKSILCIIKNFSITEPIFIV